eukprot:Hpha_TRINITY_DN16360_c0_g1::TRINITY_DN16360_c0_g1_i1::g.58242::m.58242
MGDDQPSAAVLVLPAAGGRRDHDYLQSPRRHARRPLTLSTAPFPPLTSAHRSQRRSQRRSGGEAEKAPAAVYALIQPTSSSDEAVPTRRVRGDGKRLRRLMNRVNQRALASLAAARRPLTLRRPQDLQCDTETTGAHPSSPASSGLSPANVRTPLFSSRSQSTYPPVLSTPRTIKEQRLGAASKAVGVQLARINLIRCQTRDEESSELRLPDAGLRDSNAVVLGEVMESHPGLTLVDLSGNAIGDVAGKAVLEAVRGNAGITQVALDRTCVSTALRGEIERQCRENERRGRAVEVAAERRRVRRVERRREDAWRAASSAITAQEKAERKEVREESRTERVLFKAQLRTALDCQAKRDLRAVQRRARHQQRVALESYERSVRHKTEGAEEQRRLALGATQNRGRRGATPPGARCDTKQR